MPTIDDYAPLQAGFDIFVKNHHFQQFIWKKKVISQSKMYPNMILDLPYYISKNAKKKLNFDFEIESRL